MSLLILADAVLVVALVCSVIMAEASPVLSLDGLRTVAFQRHVGRSGDDNRFGAFGTYAKASLVTLDVSAETAATPDVNGCVVFVHASAPIAAGQPLPLSSSDIKRHVLDKSPAALIVVDEVLRMGGAHLEEALVSQRYEFPVAVVQAGDPQVSKLLSETLTDIRASVAGEATAVVGEVHTVLQPQTLADALVLHAHPVAKFTKNRKADTRRVVLTSTLDAVGIVPRGSYAELSGAQAATDVFQQLMGVELQSVQPELLLTTYGRWNYLGTRFFTRNISADDSPTLVVCFDSLVGGSDTLHAHVVPRSEGSQLDESTSSFLESLRLTLAAHHISLQVHSRRINNTHFDLRFEHEVFAHRRVPTVTLSTYASPQGIQLLRHSSVGRHLPVSNDVFYLRVTSAVADAVATQNQVVRSIEERLMLDSRSLTGTAFDDGRRYGVAKHVEKHLRTVVRGSNYTLSVSQHPLADAASVTLFGPFTVSVKVYSNRALWFEFALTGAICVFVALFSVRQVGLQKTLKLASLAVEQPSTPALEVRRKK